MTTPPRPDDRWPFPPPDFEPKQVKYRKPRKEAPEDAEPAPF